MYNGLKYFLAFSLGGVVGAIVTKVLLDKKCEQIINEEVEDFKTYWSDKYPIDENNSNEIKPKETESNKCHSEQKRYYIQNPTTGEGFIDVTESVANCIIAENNYRGGVDNLKTEIYVISPDEFGENGYETVSLTYYSDKVLTDDMDEVIEDIEGTVGYDSLTRFGEYEDDSVFVRNDRRKVDYEILADLRTFSEVSEDK